MDGRISRSQWQRGDVSGPNEVIVDKAAIEQWVKANPE
jgi:hypothetical protein